MRQRWVQINHELVEVSDDFIPPVPTGPYIMPDIQPYRSQIDGSMITSRSQHRLHLKANGCIEIGNETKYLKPKPMSPPPGLKETLISVANQKLKG